VILVAKGRANTGWFVAGMIVMVMLVATNTWNPFPGIWKWVNHNGPISDPAPAWQQRIGASPQSVTIAGNAIVVDLGDSVEARRLSDGGQLWSKKADWSAVAGVAASAAVVSGKLLVKGYDVVDPSTDSLLRHDKQAVAVWTYRDAILDVRCHGSKDCTLSAWGPRATQPAWTVDLPGVGFVLFADNPSLKGIRAMTALQIAGHAGGPDTMPRLLGFPINGSTYVVDTSQGKLLPEVKPGRRDEIVVVGGRVLRITATPGDGACYFAVVASDAVTGSQVWRQAGLNMRTVSSSGCEQRDAPNGADNVVLGIGPDGRQLLMDAYDGRVLWIGAAGEKVLDVDSTFALIRAADGKSIRGILLGQSGTLWTRPAPSDAEALLNRYAVVITQKGPNRIIALDPETGREKLNVRSSAKVLACGPDGMVIGDARLVGYLPYAGSTVAGSTGPAATGSANPPNQTGGRGTEKDG
jgi:outer membrane protein assembly factor BamB